MGTTVSTHFLIMTDACFKVDFRHRLRWPTSLTLIFILTSCLDFVRVEAFVPVCLVKLFRSRLLPPF